jgi:hypothetical protein
VNEPGYVNTIHIISMYGVFHVRIMFIRVGNYSNFMQYGGGVSPYNRLASVIVEHSFYFFLYFLCICFLRSFLKLIYTAELNHLYQLELVRVHYFFLCFYSTQFLLEIMYICGVRSFPQKDKKGGKSMKEYRFIQSK